MNKKHLEVIINFILSEGKKFAKFQSKKLKLRINIIFWKRLAVSTSIILKQLQIYNRF